MIFICGKLGSGKSTYGQEVARTEGYDFVEVSSIVKSILGQTERSKLQGHPELDKEIISAISAYGKNTVVSGVRQITILQAFPESDLVWLEVSERERFARLANRIDNKDKDKTWEAFLIAQKRDADLGVDQVETYIKSNEHGRVIKA